jgi:pimeloyl-ACP methyl ester carboxylesterase
MREIYLVSGLGADKRVFAFVDWSGFKVNHIDWVDPLGNETIETYAKRLLPQIKTNRPTLIGVSFGGMVAVEIAKLIETDKVILISSASTKFDIPLYYRIGGWLRVNKLIPASLLKTVNPLTFWFFGTKTKPHKQLLAVIIREIDGKFLKWAVDKIVNWRNTTRLTNLVHIHGTLDKILPMKTVDHEIQDGGHLMIIDKGEELGQLIRRILN